MNLESTINRYNRYESSVAMIPGKDIFFDDLFLPQTKKIVSEIEKATNKKIENDLENLQFDLYGKISDFQATFTKADDKIEYLSKSTLSIFSKTDKSKIPVSIAKYFFEFFYLKDFLKFKIKNKG